MPYERHIVNVTNGRVRVLFLEAWSRHAGLLWFGYLQDILCFSGVFNLRNSGIGENPKLTIVKDRMPVTYAVPWSKVISEAWRVGFNMSPTLPPQGLAAEDLVPDRVAVTTAVLGAIWGPLSGTPRSVRLARGTGEDDSGQGCALDSLLTAILT